MEESFCYTCGKRAVWACDYLPPCDHEMCDEHYVPEYEGIDVPRHREPYTLCLEHKDAQVKLGSKRHPYAEKSK